jgi:hypothetical protein
VGFVTGYAAFDALRLVQPGRVLLLDVGTREADALVHALLAHVVQAGHGALVADGACSMNLMQMSYEADRIGLSRFDFLASLRFARGFTVHQYATILERYRARARAPELRVGLVLAAMFPVMFLDDDVDREEAKILMEDALAGLRDLAQERDIPVVVTNPSLMPGVAHPLRAVLDQGTDDQAAILPGPDETLRVEHDGRVLLAPSPSSRQRRLTEYGANLGDAEGPEPRFVVPVASPLRYVPSRAGERRALASAAP